MTHAISWFEIPVENFERAKTFYEEILSSSITEIPMPDVRYGVFSYDPENNGVGGGLIESKNFKPSIDGSILYLNGGEDCALSISKVESAGGKIIFPKTDIGENGFIGHFIDTEGNKIGIHSMK